MKKSTHFSFLFAAFAATILLTASCKQAAQDPAKPDLAQIRTEIQAMEDAYAAGLKAKDANAVIAYYADDAISMVNNAPIAVGHDALLKMAQDDIASDTTNTTVSFETVDIFAAGDLVVETGKAIYKDPSGNVAKTAKYMTLFEKRNGKYVAIRDIYNKDQK
jgi:ketosteroid isomerase-like protein